MQIPEKFQNEDGSLNSDAILKSYSELERKIGGMVSIPGDDADAESIARFRRANGVPDDISGYPIDALFDDESIRKKFLDAGLNVKQVEKIYQIANEFFTPMLQEMYSRHVESDEMKQLSDFFGGDEKMRAALPAIQTFGEKFLPSDVFESMSSNAAGIRGIYAMMQSMEPNVALDKNSSDGMTDSDLRRMMRDPKYWRDHDPEYVRKVESGFKKLYAE